MVGVTGSKGKPKDGSLKWELVVKSARTAFRGRAKRGDLEACKAAGQGASAKYGGWKKRPDGMRNAQLAVTKRLKWEERVGWTGKNCGIATPKYWQFTVIADQFGVCPTALRRYCDKARARGTFAQHFDDGTINPANPNGTERTSMIHDYFQKEADVVKHYVGYDVSFSVDA